MTVTETVFGYLSGSVVLSIVVWIGFALHTAYTQIDSILDHLSNCPAVKARAPLKHGGPWGKLLLVGGLSGIVTFPNRLLKTGQLNADDLRRFPAPLKRKLAILQWSVIGLLSFAFLLWTVGKGMDWHV